MVDLVSASDRNRKISSGWRDGGEERGVPVSGKMVKSGDKGGGRVREKWCAEMQSFSLLHQPLVCRVLLVSLLPAASAQPFSPSSSTTTFPVTSHQLFSPFSHSRTSLFPFFPFPPSAAPLPQTKYGPLVALTAHRVSQSCGSDTSRQTWGLSGFCFWRGFRLLAFALRHVLQDGGPHDFVHFMTAVRRGVHHVLQGVKS